MKRIATIALFTVASTLGAGHAFAQAREVRATMPFDFTVGSKLLPAGTYTIIPLSDNAIEIRNSATHLAILSVAFPKGEPAKSCELVFDKYADQYFLREVAGGPSNLNMDLPATKAEKNAGFLEAKVNNPSQVLIAANIVTD